MPRQATASGADPYRGRTIGRYEILTRLSVGGMAELFLAFTSGPGGFRKFVALKQILPDVKTDEFVKMFLDEARITAAFSHANIGQVFELGEEDGELYLAMEFLPGQNLEQVMIAASHVRPLPVGFAARVARDVCLGLHYAHHFAAPSGRKVAVVHRDLAPRNVMITYEGGVKVIDFGIAKAKGRIARTTVGMVKGTSGYMSPEQVRGHELDGRSDLFTAGVLLHEMLCGRRLFDTADEDAMMRQIASADIAPPRTLNPEVPEALEAVVMRSLAKEPERRFATGREMAKAVEAACRTELFDEEAVAELMQALFAEKRLKTLALLDHASRDDERVIELAGSLQKEATAGEERSAGPGARAAPRRPAAGGEPAASPARVSRPPPPARPIPGGIPRKVTSSAGDDGPTQVGPPPTKPSRPPAPEARESRRPVKMGVFTLGPAEAPPPSAPRSEPEDSETSEVSETSRVSRALKALNRPSRRGLWLILAIVLAGLAVLLMPGALRSRLGALFASAGQWASERLDAPPAPQVGPAQPALEAQPGAEPPPDAYEPPPPGKDRAEEPAKAAATPAAPAQGTARPRKQEPSAEPTRVKPAGATARKPSGPGSQGAAGAAAESEPVEAPSRAPAIQEKPEGRAAEAPVEELPEPAEPSVGPAEVDPSIQPLELDPPTPVEGEP